MKQKKQPEKLYLVKSKLSGKYLSSMRTWGMEPSPKTKDRPVVKTESSIRRLLKTYKNANWGEFDVIEVTYSEPRDLVREFFVDVL